MSNAPVATAQLKAELVQSCRPSLNCYPLFETMLLGMGRPLQATYNCAELAAFFGVTARTIQMKVADGTLPSRRLIGGGRFLPADIESYLKSTGEATEHPRPSRRSASSGIGLPR